MHVLQAVFIATASQKIQVDADPKRETLVSVNGQRVTLEKNKPV